MDFGLSEEISKDIIDKAYIVINFSKFLEDEFRDKNYGKGIKSISIGIICVHPNFDFFYKDFFYQKYIKSKRQLEYKIKLDYNSFKIASTLEVQKILSDEIIASLNIFDDLKIVDFNFEQFKTDLKFILSRL